jgi:hypothetical protein
MGIIKVTVSFLGPDDLHLLQPNVMKTTILEPVLQDGLVLLGPSDFNLQEINTNSSGIGMEMDGKILKLAWHQLCAVIFNKLCPGYFNQPQAALGHMKQSYLDGDGNLICTSIFAYYQGMMNAMCPFAGEACFPKSVCNALIDGLDKHLMAIFRCNYPNYAVLHNLEAAYQRSHFPKIIQAMPLAEDEVHSISAIACISVNGQAFKLDAMAFASQAERTLNHSSGGYTSDGAASSGYRLEGGYRSYRSTGSCDIGQRDSSFGCKGPHPCIKNGVVVCPNADQPGVHAAAQAAYDKWLEKSHARCQKRKAKNSAPTYAGLSEANKKLVRDKALAMMASGGGGTPARDSSTPQCKKPMILIVDIVAFLSAATATRGILPAPIVSNFPHIQLQLGSALDDPDCPVVRCVVDTAAAFSTGNFHFVVVVAKRYPIASRSFLYLRTITLSCYLASSSAEANL